MTALRVLVSANLLAFVFPFFGSCPALADIHYVKEMTVDEIAQLDRSRTAVILPGGILEQHGPYLPLFSDGYINEAFTKRLAEAIADRPNWDVLQFPTVPLGTGGANELGRKYSFSGTYAVRFETLRAVFMDLATELGEQGFRWIFLVHAHGAPNHNRALDEAGDYFHDTYGGEMVHLYGIVPPGQQDLRTRGERSEDGFAIHAGMDETSTLLHLQPELVKSTYKDAPPVTARGFGAVVQIAQSEAWTGYFGSPRLANLDYGKRAWEVGSNELVAIALRILDGWNFRELPRLGDMMSLIPASKAVNEDALKHDEEIARKQREWISENEAE